jgi:succinate dehydrogenase / fumarate reductase membrane anchor subunit
MSNKPSISTPLKRARGLGAAHDGTHHFWVQRLTALALIPLSIWFIAGLATRIVGHDVSAVQAWLHHPIPALVTAALVISLFWHAKLGIQTIIEDYVHCEGKKIVTLLFVNLLVYSFGAAALLAIAHLQFFGN